MKNFIKKYKIQLKILIPIFICTGVLCSLVYYLFPLLTNFKTQQELIINDFSTQVRLSPIYMMFTSIITTFVFTRFLKQYDKLISPGEKKYSVEEINLIKNKLFVTPDKICAVNAMLSIVLIMLVYVCKTRQLSIVTLKLFISILPIIILYTIISNLFITSIYKQMIIKLPGTDSKHIEKTTLKKKLTYTSLSLILSSLILISIWNYQYLAIEKADALYTTYNTELTYFSDNNTFISISDIISKANQNISLVGTSDYIFIKTSDNLYLNAQNKPIKMTSFFDKHFNEYLSDNEGRVYEEYGLDYQAAIKTIYIDNAPYIIGVYYQTINPSIIIYFLIAIVVLLIISYFILSLLSKTITNDLILITNKFNAISDSKNIIKNDKLAITSNDEIGDLINAYNRVQSLATTNIKQIAISKETLTEQERLASLGQMIGGISHNLKTPIFSIAGGIEGLNDLISELDQSIDNPNVNDQDMHDIAKDMREWTAKIKDYTSYMSDIITAVKGQAVNFSNDQIDYFTTSQLFKLVDLLMKHELKDALIDLVVDNNVDESYYIKGSINGIVQVINNIISNAIQAYDGKTNQSIVMKADLDNNMLLISIQDFGPGISKEVQNKIFKEMITTKGKNGTGLGLFMSYSNIKAHYHGNLFYKTELGKGTTFYIELPIENRKKV